MACCHDAVLIARSGYGKILWQLYLRDSRALKSPAQGRACLLTLLASDLIVVVIAVFLVLIFMFILVMTFRATMITVVIFSVGHFTMSFLAP